MTVAKHSKCLEFQVSSARIFAGLQGAEDLLVMLDLLGKEAGVRSYTYLSLVQNIGLHDDRFTAPPVGNSDYKIILLVPATLITRLLPTDGTSKNMSFPHRNLMGSKEWSLAGGQLPSSSSSAKPTGCYRVYLLV